jgi:hypothetical protein
VIGEVFWSQYVQIVVLDLGVTGDQFVASATYDPVMAHFLRRIVRTGLVAGAVGTTAMDLLWFKRQRDAGSTTSFAEWEFKGISSFDEAPAPAQVGRIAARAVKVELPDSAAGVTNNVVHWSTGATWGVAAALLRAVPGIGAIRAGFMAAIAAFTTSYAVLPKIGVYKSITQYDAKTLWKDLSAHLVFGTAVGSTLALLGGWRRRRA